MSKFPSVGPRRTLRLLTWVVCACASRWLRLAYGPVPRALPLPKGRRTLPQYVEPPPASLPRTALLRAFHQDLRDVASPPSLHRLCTAVRRGLPRLDRLARNHRLIRTWPAHPVEDASIGSGRTLASKNRLRKTSEVAGPRHAEHLSFGLAPSGGACTRFCLHRPLRRTLGLPPERYQELDG